VAVVQDLLELLVAVDERAVEASVGLRWAPLTPLLVLASAWWVKGLLFVLAGLAHDLLRRRVLPRTALASLASLGVASFVTDLVKQAVDRARPPLADVAVQAVGPLPSSPSFPSGHAATAFAAAVALAVLVPRLRMPALALAAVVAVSRVYLGVHFWLDVLAGAALGTLVGLLVAVAVRRITARGPLRAPAGAAE
jgi:undecaprenyl-diphosphatase